MAVASYITKHNPGANSTTSNASSTTMTKQWDEYRHIILSLYKEQNKPLHEVQRFMEEEHGFKASPSTVKGPLRH
ncbi:uncharacterized protein CTHT_0043950 [Thermochaetoides thermophila DSM 1495]|uniref:Clr5 domain-containing protein n=1 Tax=Chaetomium thermophilum (strain DSM 1495 / CBS 144.50 / IMI 039719) TaxID=759272 RepID=G0S8Z1_CHATD|nr:hypothetical protein CTHT_0043950 [Thermochaetoides thermophila DSM 1495]EGS19902.1 hypothetical protein CTHT_0043950 [Thermochaetoides thermophila DSM 1495]